MVRWSLCYLGRRSYRHCSPHLFEHVICLCRRSSWSSDQTQRRETYWNLPQLSFLSHCIRDVWCYKPGMDFISAPGQRVPSNTDDPSETFFLFQRHSVAIRQFNAFCFAHSFGNVDAEVWYNSQDSISSWFCFLISEGFQEWHLQNITIAMRLSSDLPHSHSIPVTCLHPEDPN